jgi:hypothetical protein
MRKRAPAFLTFGRRIKVHDRHQLELKLEYQPRDGARQSRYAVELFVCLPNSLNVSPETTPRESLYADIHNYVRLKTPELSFSELGGLPHAPLAQIGVALDAIERGGAAATAAQADFVYQCKLLACVFRANLRDVAAAAETARARGEGPAAEGVAGEARATLDEASAIAAAYRAFAARAEGPALSERARAAYRLADEYMSVSVEQMLRRAIVSLARGEASAGHAALRQTFLTTILAEEGYRKERGYPTIIDPNSDNEPYIYRSGLLKKFCSSALFLPLHRDGSRRGFQELGFAMAAGIAMAFATVVAFWAQARMKQLGLQLFVVLVVAYMFKDRLKEATRGLLARLLERGLFDRKTIIDDPAGGRLGTLREKIGFVPRERLPADAVQVRARDLDPELRIAEAELRETVIHYRKEIQLRPRRRGGGAVTDIVRFHMARFLREMDEPDGEIAYVDAETQSLGPVRAAKTYRVDVVFRFHDRPGQAPQTTLMRLVLDRNGIKRIERVDAGRTGAGP